MLDDIILYNLKATGCLVFAIRGRANQQSGKESFVLILTCYQICYQRIITDPKKFSSTFWCTTEKSNFQKAENCEERFCHKTCDIKVHTASYETMQ